MSHNIIFPAPDGATYAIPDVDDEGWGQSVTNFLTAIPAGVPPRSGTFSLTGDLSFGTSFGLVSPYYKSSTVNISTVGTLRLAKTDSIGWRNNTNSANLLLGINGSDQLTFNGSIVPVAGTVVNSITGTANQVIASSPTGNVTLSLPQSIATSSTPTFGGLTLTGTLNGTGVLLSGLTVSTALATDGSKNLVSSATTAAELGFVSGVTSSIQTQLNSKAPSNNPVFTGTIGTPLTTSSIVSTDGSGNLTTLADPLSVVHGGSGDSSHTAYAVLCGGTTSTAPVQSVSGVGSTGQALVSNGAGALPTWQNVSGSGTVNSGTAGQIAYYAGSGTTISGNTPLTISGTSLTLNGSNATFAIVGPGVTSSQLELTANSHNNQIQTDSTGRLTIADITDSHIWFTFDPAPSITAGSVLSMGSNKITNVTDPTSAQDAATKNYVDTNAHLISTPIMGTHTGFDSLSANTTFTSTSLSASIIPKSVSSKILVRVTGTCAIGSPQTQGYWTIDRSGTNLGGTNGLTQYQVPSGSVGNFVPCAMQYLDSPATTSSITYTVQQRCSSAAGTVQFGEVNGISVIILEEVI